MVVGFGIKMLICNVWWLFVVSGSGLFSCF